METGSEILTCKYLKLITKLKRIYKLYAPSSKKLND